MSHVLQAFDRHWFAPADPRDLAAVRVILVGCQLVLLVLPTDLGACPGCNLQNQRWFTEIDPSLFLPIPALKLLLAPFGWGARPEPMFLAAVWLLAVISGVLALLGRHTRASALCFAATNTLLIAHSYSYREMHHTEALLVIALWVLVLAPSGAAWSLDDLGDRLRRAACVGRFVPRDVPEHAGARWPLRLIAWLFVLIYLSAALSKLVNGGFDWANGYTMAYYLVQDGIRYSAPIGLWLATHQGLLALLSIVCLAFELTFGLAVLFPAVTLAYVLVGISLHLGIYLVQGPPFLQYFALYSVFAQPIRERWAPRRLVRAAQPKWTVVFDGLCPLCIRSMVILNYLDVRGRLRYVDLEQDFASIGPEAPRLTVAEAREAMHVVSPDGRVMRGFFAFRALAPLLPLLWPLLPLLYAPLVNRIGTTMYGAVAANRKRAVCRAQTCAPQPNLPS